MKKSTENKIIISELQDFFLKCEAKFSVDKWKLKGIHIWPILKVIIYFNLYRNSYNPGQISKEKYIRLRNLRIGIKNSIRYLYGIYSLLFLKLKKSEFIFSGAPTHRVNWKGKKFNRYFDPLLDYLESKKKKGLLLEYGVIDTNLLYRPKRVRNVANLEMMFKKRKRGANTNEFYNDLDFNKFLKEVNGLTGFKEEILKIQLETKTNTILDWANLFEYFFKKTQAKYAFGLCYYSEAMYGFNLAANNLGIPTFDVQHGLQGRLHPAYYFDNIPIEGYNVLPNNFWVWDEISYKNNKNWVKGSDHKVIKGGNPWIDYLNTYENFNLKKLDSRPIILFTLQPLEPLLADYLVQVIKKSYDKYNWWLRLHPRMNEKEINEINNSLNSQNLKEVISLKQISDLPLPLLLDNCQLHISRSSGSIGEAAMMNRYSLIIDELGVDSYDDLIREGKAFSCLTKDPDDFLFSIESTLRLETKTDEKKSGLDYKKILDDLCKI